MNPARTLILLTDTFPFGSGEAFLETEIGYLAREARRMLEPVNRIAADLEKLSKTEPPR